MTQTTPRQVSRGGGARADDAGLRMLADAPVFSVFQQLGCSPRGLTEAEAAERLSRYGDNQPYRPTDDDTPGSRLIDALRSPFVALLCALSVVFVVAGDIGAAVTIAVMVILAVLLRFWQRTRSTRAIRAVRQLVTSTVTVRRRADVGHDPVERDVSVDDLVPGDIVRLRGGDVVPADMRVVSGSGLVVDQSVLTGESVLVSKAASSTDEPPRRRREHPPALVAAPTVCFSGTAVVAGTVTAVVIATGKQTYLASLASSANDQRPESSFDRGVRMVSRTLVRFMLVLALTVVAVNGLASGNWVQAAMFAAAVAVGLTPELLPVIVTSNLARGAVRLAHERVIVNRLNTIQDLGAVDVMCVDKTGTLTEDRIVCAHSVDISGRFDDAVAEFAYLAVHFQDGMRNQLDDAVADAPVNSDMQAIAEAAFSKVDEIGFDYPRRRSTVVVSRQGGEHIVICKGDPDQVLPLCTQARLGDEIAALDDDLRAEGADLVYAYRRTGLRVLAIAMKQQPARLEHYRESDENDLTLAGFVCLVDPVRESAAGAVASLEDHGVEVKILTGDNKVVARQVANIVGVSTDVISVGADVDCMTDRQLKARAHHCAVFAELSPAHKTRIIAALRADGRAVGFIGDGINDVAALRLADAGIAADTATDVAKQAADMVLLDKDLAVVANGVVEGRRTLANTMKYVKITASSNFGNALTVVAASAFLPFLPMLPIQLLVQNILYDTAQLSLPWDRVDHDYLQRPRRWQSNGLVGFMLTFGPLSSLFDLATFGVLWWVFGLGDAPARFQTGWFLEGLLTQLAVVFILRGRPLPWTGARPSAPLVVAAASAAVVGLLLALTPLAAGFAMQPPPPGYLWWLLIDTVGYVLCAHMLKKLYLRHHPDWV